MFNLADFGVVPTANLSQRPAGKSSVFADFAQANAQGFPSSLRGAGLDGQFGWYSLCGIASCQTVSKAARQSSRAFWSVLSWRSTTSPSPLKTEKTTVLLSNNQKSLPGSAIGEARR